MVFIAQVFGGIFAMWLLSWVVAGLVFRNSDRIALKHRFFILVACAVFGASLYWLTSGQPFPYLMAVYSTSALVVFCFHAFFSARAEKAKGG